MLKVWQRTDRRTFCIANALDFKSKVAAAIADYYRKASGKSKEELASILVENWEQQEDSFIKVLKEIFPENEFRSHYMGLRCQIVKILKALTMENCREEKILKDAQIQQTELIQEVQKLSEDEKKPISEAAKEICEKKGIKSDEVIKAVESTLTKARGTKLESKTVEVFGKEKGVEFTEVPNLLMGKVMECDGVEWVLQGRADALLEDKVIEVKNRRSRFMQPLYDLIQLQAYLFLYDRTEGILLERLNEENKETPVKFEVGFWIDDVIPGMKEFIMELQSLIDRNIKRFSENLCQVNDDTTPKSPSKRPHEKCDNSLIQKKIMCVNEQEKPGPSDILSNSPLAEKPEEKCNAAPIPETVSCGHSQEEPESSELTSETPDLKE
ncbi:hypothetical protein QZH41_006772 [Actinostola sp. cb2023]|nr:hypothetical protein QZH41_006772 [Actinostola sp. cb2023]